MKNGENRPGTETQEWINLINYLKFRDAVHEMIKRSRSPEILQIINKQDKPEIMEDEKMKVKTNVKAGPPPGGHEIYVPELRGKT